MQLVCCACVRADVQRAFVLSRKGVRRRGCMGGVFGPSGSSPPAPDAAFDSLVNHGFASPLSLWAPGSPAPFRCNVCSALDAANRREVVADTCEDGCCPMLFCKDIFVVGVGWRSFVGRPRLSCAVLSGVLRNILAQAGRLFCSRPHSPRARAPKRKRLRRSRLIALV